MKLNHPRVHTFEQDLTVVIPSEVIPGRHLDHLHASPSCTHHSRACGGRPRSKQLRAQPNIVLDWVDDIDVSRLSVENVPEFTNWGPLDDEGNPIKSQKGTLFDVWVKSLEARNFEVEWRIVNCADFGDATTRKRFFLKAVKKGRGKIVWPEPTFSQDGAALPRWRGVKECLDFADTGRSIFNRARPLAPATMERIAVGAQRYWGVDIRPFIVRMNRNCYAESIDAPCSALTTSGAHHMLCTPIVVDHCNNGKCYDGSSPLGTVMTHDRYSLVTPLILGQHNGASAKPVDEPGPTITTTSRGIRLVTPLILGQQGGAVCHPATEPCPTVSCGGAIRSIFPQLADGRIVDIHIRMLRPDELARVHSFPDDYVITGNRTEKVKQIGNSVPCRTARAMMLADLKAEGLAA
jgi:DNA (cytosine-5)-methyltransferase 1